MISIWIFPSRIAIAYPKATILIEISTEIVKNLHDFLILPFFGQSYIVILQEIKKYDSIKSKLTHTILKIQATRDRGSRASITIFENDKQAYNCFLQAEIPRFCKENSPVPDGELIIAEQENSSSANSLHQIPVNGYDGLIDQSLL